MMIQFSLIVIAIAIVGSYIWMIRDGWYKGDEYYITFSLKGNTTSFWPFVPKVFCLVFLYYLLAKYVFGGDAHATSYIPLIISGILYVIVTFGYFKAHKSSRKLYLMMFSGAFLLSTIPQYLLIFINTDGTARNTASSDYQSSSTNSEGTEFDKDISDQREAYITQQSEAQRNQEEVNARAMGFHSADEAKQNGMDV